MQTYVKIGPGGEAGLPFIHDMCHDEEPIGGRILPGLAFTHELFAKTWALRW
jgi:hypothetical protein